MADSFQGGVDLHGEKRGERRAQVAVVGSNVEALTGGEIFRIALAQCSLVDEGQRFVVRDAEGKLAIWSDELNFLDALEMARRGVLLDQVRRIRNARRRRRILGVSVKVLVAAAFFLGVGLPLARWALSGGVSSISDRIGESALEQLHLPTGQAPTVEKRLSTIVEQLRPATTLPSHSFRLLLADYSDVHTFHMPPDVVVVTSSLICSAEDPNLVLGAVALELAHLEAHDMTTQMTATVDWRTTFDFMTGDTTKLRTFLLDFADSRHSPGYKETQEKAANERAIAILKQTVMPLDSAPDIAALMDRVKRLVANPPHTGPVQAQNSSKEATDWAEVREDACAVVGH